MIGKGVVGRQLFNSFGLTVDQEELSCLLTAEEESPAIAEPNGIPPKICQALVGFRFEGIDEDPRVPSGALDSLRFKCLGRNIVWIKFFLLMSVLVSATRQIDSKGCAKPSEQKGFTDILSA